MTSNSGVMAALATVASEFGEPVRGVVAEAAIASVVVAEPKPSPRERAAMESLKRQMAQREQLLATQKAREANAFKPSEEPKPEPVVTVTAIEESKPPKIEGVAVAVKPAKAIAPAKVKGQPKIEAVMPKPTAKSSHASPVSQKPEPSLAKAWVAKQKRGLGRDVGKPAPIAPVPVVLMRTAPTIDQAKLEANLNTDLPGIELFPWQTEGAEFLISKNEPDSPVRHRKLLAYDMGLGKTFATIIAARAFQLTTGCDVYIFSPIGVQGNWADAMYLAGVNGLIFGHYDGNFIDAANLIEASDRPAYVIVDEADCFRSPLSKRSGAFTALCAIPKIVGLALLTGTPIPNGLPANAFVMLAACRHPIARDYREFSRTFPPVERGKEDDQLKFLHKSWTETYPMMRRKTKDDADIVPILNLPAAKRMLVKAKLSPDAWNVYIKRLNDLFEAYYERVEEGNAAKNFGAILVAIGNLRRAGSWAKIEACWGIAQPYLEQGQQVVIFTCFLDTAWELSRLYTEQGTSNFVLSGALKGPDRDAAVAKFQAGETQVAICLTGAGGVGITMTASQVVIMHDRPWNNQDQCEARVHRITQDKECTFIWPQLLDVDQCMDYFLLRKCGTASQVVDGWMKTIEGIEAPMLRWKAIVDRMERYLNQAAPLDDETEDEE